MGKLGELRRILWGESLFRRMYLSYALIIILLMALLGMYMARSFSAMIVTRALEYNKQQLSSLEITYTQQISTLQYLITKIYEVQADTAGSIYDSIQFILKGDKPFASLDEYNEFIDRAYNILTFFRLVQSSLRTEMSLFQIKGAERGQGNINILWPVDNIGMVEYAEEITEFIEKMERYPPSSGYRGKIRLFPFTSKSGPVSKRNFYIMYDYIVDKNNRNKVIGYLINGYNTSDLNRVLNSFSYPLTGTAYILDSNGVILYASDLSGSGMTPGFFPLIESDSENDSGGVYRRGGNIYNVIHNKEYNFYVVGEIPEYELSNDVTRRNISILLMSLLFASAAIFLTFLSTRSVQRRVRRITNTMAVAETGDLSARAGVSKYNDELDRIASGLNSMIININDHINTEYLSELRRKNAELKQREAELSALQAEINPHFLYNTLESIRMQALLNRDHETARLIRLLANLFRNRIKNGNVVKINDEIIYCGSLVEILSARYCGAIDLSLDIPDEIKEFGILKDLLQPILENAFMHGFGDDYEETKYLTISGAIDAGGIDLRVKNNGNPIDGEHLRRIRGYLENRDSGADSGNLGLFNVHQRIRMVYGDRYGVFIESGEREGTVVGIKIAALSVDELRKMIDV
jgi:two-component system sensor histidine kinase YesM